MSNLRQFHRALVEASAPAFRDALQGKEVDEDEVVAELEYQLKARGVIDEH